MIDQRPDIVFNGSYVGVTDLNRQSASVPRTYQYDASSQRLLNDGRRQYAYDEIGNASHVVNIEYHYDFLYLCPAGRRRHSKINPPFPTTGWEHPIPTGNIK